MTQNHRSVATAFMAQMNGGFNATDAKGIDEPMTTERLESIADRIAGGYNKP